MDNHGPGRTLPATSATGTGFIQETADPTVADGVSWVTAAQVLAALTEIDAAAEIAAGLAFSVLPSSITTTTTAKPGGVYFLTAAAAATLNLPSAAVAAAVAGKSNRQVTLMNLSAATTVYAAATIDHINGSTSRTLTSQYTSETYDTDGTHWYRV